MYWNCLEWPDLTQGQIYVSSLYFFPMFSVSFYCLNPVKSKNAPKFKINKISANLYIKGKFYVM